MFTTTSNMYAHMKNNCKNKKEINKIKIVEKSVNVQKFVDLERDNAELKKQLNEIENQLRKEIAELKKGTIQINNLTTNSIDNSTTNNGTINNNQVTNNYILVAYGKEDMSKIDKIEIANVMKMGFKSIAKLTEIVHFDPLHPENHNIYISSMKSKYAMKYNGTDWDVITKHELLDEIYNQKKNYIENNLENFDDDLTKSQRDSLKRWLETDDDSPKIQKIKEEIKLLLHNKQKIPLETMRLAKAGLVKYSESEKQPHDTNKEPIITEPELSKGMNKKMDDQDLINTPKTSKQVKPANKQLSKTLKNATNKQTK